MGCGCNKNMPKGVPNQTVVPKTTNLITRRATAPATQPPAMAPPPPRSFAASQSPAGMSKERLSIERKKRNAITRRILGQ